MKYQPVSSSQTHTGGSRTTRHTPYPPRIFPGERGDNGLCRPITWTVSQGGTPSHWGVLSDRSVRLTSYTTPLRPTRSLRASESPWGSLTRPMPTLVVCGVNVYGGLSQRRVTTPYGTPLSYSCRGVCLRITVVFQCVWTEKGNERSVGPLSVSSLPTVEVLTCKSRVSLARRGCA